MYDLSSSACLFSTVSLHPFQLKASEFLICPFDFPKQRKGQFETKASKTVDEPFIWLGTTTSVLAYLGMWLKLIKCKFILLDPTCDSEQCEILHGKNKIK